MDGECRCDCRQHHACIKCSPTRSLSLTAAWQRRPYQRPLIFVPCIVPSRIPFLHRIFSVIPYFKRCCIAWSSMICSSLADSCAETPQSDFPTVDVSRHGPPPARLCKARFPVRRTKQGRGQGKRNAVRAGQLPVDGRVVRPPMPMHSVRPANKSRPMVDKAISAS